MESHMKHLCCSSFKSEGMMSAREVDMIHDQTSQSKVPYPMDLDGAASANQFSARHRSNSNFSIFSAS